MSSVRLDRLQSNWDNGQWPGQFHSPYIHESWVTHNSEASPVPNIPSIQLRQGQWKPQRGWMGTYVEQRAPTEHQGRFMKYTWFMLIHITDGSCNHNYLSYNFMKLSMLQILWGVNSSGYGRLTYLDKVSKLLNQQWYPIWLQIWWPIWLPVSLSSNRHSSKYWSSDCWSYGSCESEVLYTPNVLKWLADTIHDYQCQLSPVAADWTTESNHCKERAICATSILFHQTSQQKQINRQQANMDMCPYYGIQRGFFEIQWRWFQFQVLSEL